MKKYLLFIVLISLVFIGCESKSGVVINFYKTNRDDISDISNLVVSLTKTNDANKVKAAIINAEPLPSTYYNATYDMSYSDYFFDIVENNETKRYLIWVSDDFTNIIFCKWQSNNMYKFNTDDTTYIKSLLNK